jgi:hypothetical protein
MEDEDNYTTSLSKGVEVGNGCYYIHSKLLDFAFKTGKLNYLLNNC